MDIEAVDHGVGEHAVDGGELAHQVEGDNQLGVIHLENVDEVSSLPRVSWKLKLGRELNSRVRESRPASIYLQKFYVTKILFTEKKIIFTLQACQSMISLCKIHIATLCAVYLNSEFRSSIQLFLTPSEF